MSPARTLADRFRKQRTERIRVDDIEVLSVVELFLRPTSSIELIIERQRNDVAQGLSIRSRTQAARVVAVDADETERSAVELIEIESSAATRIEIAGDDENETVLQLWNTWTADAKGNAWTGNSGIIVEDLQAPPGANLRFRMWCSDGFGDASFDDLVVLATVGERTPKIGASHL